MMKQKTADRINPDSIQTLWFTVVLVGFLAIASFMVSFTGLRDVAAWAGIPVWLRWAVPVFIDVAILAYTMAVLIHRSRGEKVWASWVSLGGFTLFSMMANAAHAIALDHPNMWQRGIGAAIAALAPLAVFAATEQLGRLVIRDPKATAAAAAREAANTLPVPEWTPPTGGEPVPVIPEQEAETLATFENVLSQGGFFAAAEDQATPAMEARPADVALESVDFLTLVDEKPPLPVPEAAVEPAPQSAPSAPSAPAEPVIEAPIAVVASDAVVEAPEAPEAALAVAQVVEVAPAPVVEASSPVVSRPIVPVARKQDPVPVTLTPVWPIERPRLSLVGDAPRSIAKAESLADWVAVQVADGKVPTGKGAAEFLNVSERTGRTRLNALRETDPVVFEVVQTEKNVSAK